MDKKNIMSSKTNPINKSTDNIKQNMLTFNKKPAQISEYYTNKPLRTLNINNNKQNNGINQIYKKVNFNIDNEPKPSNYTYKKINIKYKDKQNDIYSFDNINRDKIFNTVSPTENNTFIKPYRNRKQPKYFNTEGDLNNLSFEGYQNKNNEMNRKPEYSHISYGNFDKRQLINNKINNKVLYKNVSERNPNGLYNAIFRNKGYDNK